MASGQKRERIKNRKGEWENNNIQILAKAERKSNALFNKRVICFISYISIIFLGIDIDDTEQYCNNDKRYFFEHVFLRKQRPVQQVIYREQNQWKHCSLYFR